MVVIMEVLLLEIQRIIWKMLIKLRTPTTTFPWFFWTKWKHMMLLIQYYYIYLFIYFLSVEKLENFYFKNKNFSRGVSQNSSGFWIVYTTKKRPNLNTLHLDDQKLKSYRPIPPQKPDELWNTVYNIYYHSVCRAINWVFFYIAIIRKV